MTVKIIHQIWSSIFKPLPEFYIKLGETWKNNHSDWEYILWDEEMMDNFMNKEYPEYYIKYKDFKYDIQRWDTIRFFILKKMGGIYVDVDYECLKNMEELIKNTSFAIAEEPELHSMYTDFDFTITNALMYSNPNHFFLDKCIEYIFNNVCPIDSGIDKLSYVLKTTGVEMLTLLYHELTDSEKEKVKLLPARNVTPFNHIQLSQLKSGVENDELEQCLEEAYAVHYYSYLWE